MNHFTTFLKKSIELFFNFFVPILRIKGFEEIETLLLSLFKNEANRLIPDEYNNKVKAIVTFHLYENIPIEPRFTIDQLRHVPEHIRLLLESEVLIPEERMVLINSLGVAEFKGDAELPHIGDDRVNSVEEFLRKTRDGRFQGADLKRSKDGDRRNACIICGNVLKFYHKKIIPRCGHIRFHFECIFTWMQRSTKCPFPSCGESLLKNATDEAKIIKRKREKNQRRNEKRSKRKEATSAEQSEQLEREMGKQITTES